tara:strand:- start:880 stop:1326 length:447 start_codon:yes stop_codon:yes gene_type:complete
MKIIFSLSVVFILTIVLKIILYKILKLKNTSWPQVTILSYFTFSFLSYYCYFSSDYLIEFFILNTLFLISYMLFLPIIFNESPSVYFLQNIKNKNLKKNFINKKFVSGRLKMMKKDKLINSKYKLTKKGFLTYKTIIFLSNLFLNDIN